MGDFVMELWAFMKERKKFLAPSNHHGARTSWKPDCPDPGIGGCSVHLYPLLSTTMQRTKASVCWGGASCTVSCESTRNASRGRPYRACSADAGGVWARAQPRRQRKLLTPSWLWQYLRTHLAQGCCLPEQIAGRLPARVIPGRHAETAFGRDPLCATS